MTPHVLPVDHEERLVRVRASLAGLSVGDAFGQRFFTRHAPMLIERRAVPEPPWEWTDDTAMALSIVEVLTNCGRIDQDELAQAFARRFVLNPLRGYGEMAIRILNQFSFGAPWRSISYAAFGGQGSCGNGGAMRAAPVGAYFADDLGRAAEEARLSAEVTHAHPEGQAGAMAIAVAAAWAVRWHDSGQAGSPFEAVLDHTPAGETRVRVEFARGLALETPAEEAARLLGNGSQVLSQDTVAFCVWCVARHPSNFAEALWTTVSGLGDRDTTCAIVGGVVALACGEEKIPPEWIEAREPLSGF